MTCTTAVQRAAASWARPAARAAASAPVDVAHAPTYTASYRWGPQGEAYVARNGARPQLIYAGYRPRAFDTERRQNPRGREPLAPSDR